MKTEWTGVWWLPGQDHLTYGGVLRQADDGGLRLALAGGFDDSIWETLPDGSAAMLGTADLLPVVLGQCGNHAFSLFDCMVVHAAGDPGAPFEQSLQPARALKGKHLKKNDAIFKSCEISIDYLLDWSSLSSTTVKFQTNESDGTWNGFQFAESRPPADIVIDHDSWRYTLVHSYTMFRFSRDHTSGRRDVASTEAAHLKIQRHGSAMFAFEDLDNTIKALQDLISLSVGAPAGVQGELLETTERRKCEVLGRRIYAAGSNPRTDPWPYLFTLEHVDFSQVLPTWIELHKRATMPLNMLFGNLYRQSDYIGSQLLTAAAAAEGLHREIDDRSPMSDEEFEAFRVAALEGVAGSEFKEGRRLLRKSLHNRLDFADRLRDLAKIPDARAVELLIPDVEAWAKRVKDARNGVAHGMERQDRKDPDHMMYLLSQATIGLLLLVLLEKLGVSGDQQVHAISSHGKLSYAGSELRRAFDRLER